MRMFIVLGVRSLCERERRHWEQYISDRIVRIDVNPNWIYWTIHWGFGTRIFLFSSRSDRCSMKQIGTNLVRVSRRRKLPYAGYLGLNDQIDNVGSPFLHRKPLLHRNRLWKL